MQPQGVDLGMQSALAAQLRQPATDTGQITEDVYSGGYEEPEPVPVGEPLSDPQVGGQELPMEVGGEMSLDASQFERPDLEGQGADQGPQGDVGIQGMATLDTPTEMSPEEQQAAMEMLGQFGGEESPEDLWYRQQNDLKHMRRRNKQEHEMRRNIQLNPNVDMRRQQVLQELMNRRN
jgi:hypothetical protein